MQVEGSSANVRSLSSDSLSRSKILIYSGIVDSDDFIVYFWLDPDELQKADAGKYKGQVNYIVEAGQLQKKFTLDIDCEIQPIFTMEVSLPSQGVSFGHVVANSPAQEKEVRVVVRSNLHKPYQVVQNMSSLMTNQQGKEFDKNHFNFKVILGADQKGRTKYTDLYPVEIGEYPIYSSDGQGNSITFSVVYQLQGYFDMSSGNFVAPLKLSLNQN
jgi:hypothetical protein